MAGHSMLHFRVSTPFSFGNICVLLSAAQESFNQFHGNAACTKIFCIETLVKRAITFE